MIDASLRAQREALVRRHIDVELAGDADALVATFATPRYDLVATGAVLEGADAVAGRVHALAEQMPGATMDVVSMRHADDAVIVETVTRGLHLGPLLGMAPTGKPYETRGLAIFRFAGVELVEEIVYYDRLSLMDQLRSDSLGKLDN
jgi:steroid delta-isomerase-like uncharacterized protein